ncbi:hypothetical protein AX17_004088 [Amanita inopinata Kibby_2008]|nr:hypothetical protein AX17_004088 [Amanita inopinata Kibby_2008]
MTTTQVIERIHLSNGLDGLDDYYERLERLYEKLQLATVEASNLGVDFLTFANNVYSFAGIVRIVYEKRIAISQDGAERKSSDPPQSTGLVGFVYLTSSYEKSNPLYAKELNMGIIVDSTYQQRRYGKRAMGIALKRAFGASPCRRVQATIVNPLSSAKFPAYRLFASAGFRQEGIRRRSHYNSFDNEWQDVAYMAILDTEWFRRQQEPKTSVTMWDEMIDRHEREREDMLRWEERMGRKGEVETGARARAEAEAERVIKTRVTEPKAVVETKAETTAKKPQYPSRRAGYRRGRGGRARNWNGNGNGNNFVPRKKQVDSGVVERSGAS